MRFHHQGIKGSGTGTCISTGSHHKAVKSREKSKSKLKESLLEICEMPDGFLPRLSDPAASESGPETDPLRG